MGCLVYRLLFFDLKVQSGKAERTVYRLGFVVDLNCEPKYDRGQVRVIDILPKYAPIHPPNTAASIGVIIYTNELNVVGSMFVLLINYVNYFHCLIISFGY